MTFPQDLLYTPEHEWVRIEGNIATVGITEFAQGELGDIVFVEIETIGQKVERNSVFGTVEAVKTVADLFMPLSGEVVEVNAPLVQNPEWVNSDPYGKGWMIKIAIEDPNEANGLMGADAYQQMVGA